MKSRIYIGDLSHRRFLPHEHMFSYKLFMMFLDLDELPGLFKRFWFWSYQKFNIASFDRNHYFGDKNMDLKECVLDLVERETGNRPSGPVRLLTHLRYFGFIFNPVSFFYCYEADGKTVNSIVAEVNNTPWNEKHCYVLKPEDAQNGFLHFTFNKRFHVSPFNSMDQRYSWHFTLPAEELTVYMKVIEAEKKHFDATMKLNMQEINSFNLAKVLIRFPLMTTKVVFSIYYQAFRLWLKKTRFYTHPGESNVQSPQTKAPKG